LDATPALTSPSWALALDPSVRAEEPGVLVSAGVERASGLLVRGVPDAARDQRTRQLADQEDCPTRTLAGGRDCLFVAARRSLALEEYRNWAVATLLAVAAMSAIAMALGLAG
jgi:hypothetical protein